MKYTDSERAVIVLDSMLGLEYKYKIKLLSLVKEPSRLLEASKTVENYIDEAFPEGKANTVKLALFDKNYHDHVFGIIEKYETVCVTLYSENYPKLLKQTDIPPLVLYCNGNPELLNKEKTFAIVGSRKCMPYATELAKDFSGKIAKSGAIVVTGSAGGADKAAIDGAIDSGNLISVLAGGIGHIYPEYNKTAILKIAKTGLVISEQSPDCAVKPWMFPVRNRIIAGLSQGVLIVGGDRESGARHTANYAADYGREVFAFPYSIGIKSGELNNELIKSGANLCDDINDIFDFLKIDENSEDNISLKGDEAEIYDAIKEGFDDVNKLVLKTGKKMFELAPILSSLEIEGLIVKLAGNKYKTVK